MKIKYSLSVEDFIAWRNWADYNIPHAIRNRRWHNFFLALVISIMPLAIIVTVYKNWDSQFALGTAVIAGILIFFFTFLAYKNSAAAMSEMLIRSSCIGRRSIGHIGPHTLELQDQILIETNDAEQLFSKLIRISEILESPEHVLIVLFNGTHLIPRKKVEEGDLQEFIKELRLRFAATLESSVEADKPLPLTAPKKKIQGGIYFFILAAVIAIPSLISFAIKSSAVPGEMERCVKIINACTQCERCKDFLRAEIFFNISAPLSAMLLMISLYMFFRNSQVKGKPAHGEHTDKS